MLIEHVCPHCLGKSILTPIPHKAYDLHACSVCKGEFVPLQDGTPAIALPPEITVSSTRELFDLGVANWFSTFGVVDRALRFRIDREHVTWSRYPLLGRIRFDEKWESSPRDAVRRFDWRYQEDRAGGGGEPAMWTTLVLVAIDGSEIDTRHSFNVAFGNGLAITTLLQWAHDAGVG